MPFIMILTGILADFFMPRGILQKGHIAAIFADFIGFMVCMGFMVDVCAKAEALRMPTATTVAVKLVNSFVIVLSPKATIAYWRKKSK